MIRGNHPQTSGLTMYRSIPDEDDADKTSKYHPAVTLMEQEIHPLWILTAVCILRNLLARFDAVLNRLSCEAMP